MITRITKLSESDLSGPDALVAIARDLMAAQARGEMPHVHLSLDGRVTLRWQNGHKVSYLTGVDTSAVPVTRK